MFNDFRDFKKYRLGEWHVPQLSSSEPSPQSSTWSHLAPRLTHLPLVQRKCPAGQCSLSGLGKTLIPDYTLESAWFIFME